jgi:hypothetical protein
MIGRRIITLSRWMLLLSTVAVVWLWGGTRPWIREPLSWLLLADSGLFLLGLLLSRRLPRVPWPALIPMLFLLGYGWLLTLNSPSAADYVINAESFPCEGLVLGSVAAFVPRFVCMPSMLLQSGLLGAFMIACDLSLNRLWRQRLWITLSACGAGFVILALAQRFSGAHAIFWNLYEDPGPNFFGTFRYHANAGAYLNLVLPLMAGLALLPRKEGVDGFARAAWISTALITFGACFVNISRGAEIVTGILVLAGLPWLMILSGFRSSTRLLLCLAGIILLGAILALSFGTDRTQDKWRQSSLKDEGRLLTYRTILQDTLPLTGYWGTGPGSFESVFQAVVENNHLPVQGRWDKAHNDHLQTLLEWGAPGYLCWVLLLGGALIRGFVLSRRGDGLPSRMLGACGVLSLSGVILHALGDFPLQIPSLLLVTLCIAGLLWGTEIPPLRTRS